MISRYSSPRIEKIWSLENKFSIWTKIECLVAEKLATNGIIPKNAAEEIKKKIRFNVEEIELIEKETKHDVIAYINNVSSYIGESAKYFHHGITSSDIIDTSFSIQLKQSAEIIINQLSSLLEILKEKAHLHKQTVIIGRSHGIHAEPITFGIKLASFYCEFRRNLERLISAKREVSICSISGPVGTFNSIDPSVEEFVAKAMDLQVEKVSTQIIPRDRHAVFFTSLSILASSIERLAIEIRHLQRTEVSEVEEFFDTNQIGSSSMPHKRNPVLSENLTGIARYIRSSIIPFLENIALWHERDISHSSVERILAPDVTIATDFALSRMTMIIKNLIVYPEKMKKNLESYSSLHKSQNVLLKLTQMGVSRQKAYKLVQSAAMESLDSNKNFDDVIKTDPKILKYINKQDLGESLFSNNKIKHIDKIFKKAFEN